MRKKSSVLPEKLPQHNIQYPSFVRSLFFVLSLLATSTSTSGQTNRSLVPQKKELSYIFKQTTKKVVENGDSTFNSHGEPSIWGNSVPHSNAELINTMNKFAYHNSYQRIKTHLFSPDGFSELLLQNPVLCAEFFTYLSAHQEKTLKGELASSHQTPVNKALKNPGGTMYGPLKANGPASYIYDMLFDKLPYEVLIYLYRLRDVHDNLAFLQSQKLDHSSQIVALEYFSNENKNIFQTIEHLISPLKHHKNNANTYDLSHLLDHLYHGLSIYQNRPDVLDLDADLITATSLLFDQSDNIFEKRELFLSLFSPPSTGLSTGLRNPQAAGEFLLNFLLISKFTSGPMWTDFSSPALETNTSSPDTTRFDSLPNNYDFNKDLSLSSNNKDSTNLTIARDSLQSALILFEKSQNSGGDLFRSVLNSLLKDENIVGITDGQGGLWNLSILKYFFNYSTYRRDIFAEKNKSSHARDLISHFSGETPLSGFDVYMKFDLSDDLSWANKKVLLSQYYKIARVRAFLAPDNAEKLLSLISGGSSDELPMTETDIMLYWYVLKVLGFTEKGSSMASKPEELIPAATRFVKFQKELGKARVDLETALNAYGYDDGELLITLANLYIGLETNRGGLENSPLQVFYSVMQNKLNTTPLASIVVPQSIDNAQSYLDSLDFSAIKKPDLALGQVYLCISHQILSSGQGKYPPYDHLGESERFSNQFREYISTFNGSLLGGNLHLGSIENREQTHYKLLQDLGLIRKEYLKNLLSSLTGNPVIESYHESQVPIDFSANRKNIEQDISFLTSSLKTLDEILSFGSRYSGNFEVDFFVNLLFPSDSNLSYNRANFISVESKKFLSQFKTNLSNPDFAVHHTERLTTDYIYLLYMLDHNDDSFSYDSHLPLLGYINGKIANADFSDPRIGHHLDSTFALEYKGLFESFSLKKIEADFYDWNQFFTNPQHTKKILNFFSDSQKFRSGLVMDFDDPGLKQMAEYLSLHARWTEEESLSYCGKIFLALKNAELIGPQSSRAKKEKIKKYKQNIRKRLEVTLGKEKARLVSNKKINTLAEYKYTTSSHLTLLEIASRLGINQILEKNKDLIDILLPFINEHRENLGDRQSVGLRYLLLARHANDDAFFSMENINFMIETSDAVVNLILVDLPVDMLFMTPGLGAAHSLGKVANLAYKMKNISKIGSGMSHIALSAGAYASYVGAQSYVYAKPVSEIASVKDGIVFMAGMHIAKWFQQRAGESFLFPDSDVIPRLSGWKGKALISIEGELAPNFAEVLINAASGSSMRFEDFVQNLALGLTFDAVSGGWTHSSQASRPMKISVIDGKMSMESSDHTFLNQSLFLEKAEQAGFTDPGSVILFVDPKGHLYINIHLWKGLSETQQNALIREEKVHQYIMRLKTPVLEKLLRSFSADPVRLLKASNYLSRFGVDLAGLSKLDIINEIIADYFGRMAYTPPIVSLSDPWIFSILDDNNLLFLRNNNSFLDATISTRLVNDDFNWGAAAASRSKAVANFFQENLSPQIIRGSVGYNDFMAMHSQKIVIDGQDLDVSVYEDPSSGTGAYCLGLSGETSVSGTSSATSDVVTLINNSRGKKLSLQKDLDLSERNTLYIDGQRIDISSLGKDISVSYTIEGEGTHSMLKLSIEDAISGRTIVHNYKPTLQTFLFFEGYFHQSTHVGFTHAPGIASLQNIHINLAITDPLSLISSYEIDIDGTTTNIDLGEIISLVSESNAHPLTLHPYKNDPTFRLFYSGIENAYQSLILPFPTIDFSQSGSSYPSIVKRLKADGRVFRIKNINQCEELIGDLQKHILAIENIRSRTSNPDAFRYLSTQLDILSAAITSLEASHGKYSTQSVPFEIVMDFATGTTNTLHGRNKEPLPDQNFSTPFVYSHYAYDIFDHIGALSDKNKTVIGGLPIAHPDGKTGSEIIAQFDGKPGGNDISHQEITDPLEKLDYKKNGYYTMNIGADGSPMRCFFYESDDMLPFMLDEISRSGKPGVFIKTGKKTISFSVSGTPTQVKNIDIERLVTFLGLDNFLGYVRGHLGTEGNPLRLLEKHQKRLSSTVNMSPFQSELLTLHRDLLGFLTLYGENINKEQLYYLKKSIVGRMKGFLNRYQYQRIIGPQKDEWEKMMALISEAIDSFDSHVDFTGEYPMISLNPGPWGGQQIIIARLSGSVPSSAY